MIYLTSPLHDIGKVGIPDYILLKPGPLTPEEMAIMQRHTEIGGETLDTLATALRSPLPAHGPRHRLEPPRALRRHRLSPRLVWPTDSALRSHRRGRRCLRALTSKRVYKEAYAHELAKSAIREGCGNHFDPAVVDAFFTRTGFCASEGGVGRTARFGLADELSPPTLPSRARARNRLSLLVTRSPFLPVLVLVLVIASRSSSLDPPSFPCSCSCS